MNRVTLLSLILAMTANAETARWADSTIPLKEGLELWLDASRENEAREAHYMNRLADAQAMEVWHDSSGKSRHLTQWSSVFRPLWRNGAVEFLDDDYLAALISPGLESRECTIFVVASPTRADGDFPGMFSAARRDENDYTSGLALDFGRTPGPEGFADWLNVEGAGQTGARNLLISPVATGKGHLFTVTSGPQGTQLRADGTARGQRERGKVAFAMDRVAVGARFVEPEMRHFFHGQIAEVVFYNRRLADDEIARMERWLSAKHAGFLRGPDPNLVKLEPVKDAPAVQMLVPGFRVDELKIETTNLNNIEYAPDGRLFAGGYDGRFHLLRDKDGDGIEETLDTFSGGTSDNYPVGMAVKDGMPHYLLADEIVRFRDTDRDGVPDKRETVVKGWDDPKLRDDPGLMHRRVDSAMALAAGPDGSWYVTMGRNPLILRTSAAGACCGSRRTARWSSSTAGCATSCRCSGTNTANSSARIRKGRRGFPTETRSTSCCICKQGGTMDFRRGIRSCCRTWWMSQACGTTRRSTRARAGSASTDRRRTGRASVRSSGRMTRS